MAESSSSRLSGRRAVVTGASRGIGLAIAERFSAEGAEVVLAGRSAAELDDAVCRIRHRGGRAHAAVADVTRDEDVRQLANHARDVLGAPVDVLVNNAGRYLARAFADTTIDEWSSILDANVLGAVRTTVAFLDQLTASSSSRVIVMASTGGKWPAVGQAAYNTSKHAIVGLTRCLALELAGRGVRVNAICPGYVDTGMVDADGLSTHVGVPAPDVLRHLAARSPMGRLVTTDEIAELAVYLASPLADGMTGQSLTLSAGTLFV